ncbi:MAG: hypothetical protein IJ958_00415 [Agathobacter sp.]|nr:hypothetical protein [Agathobacter sp.]
MTKKKTNNRKRSKAEQQKQKLMITGGLAGVLVLVIIIAVVVLGGCSSYEADANTVYILENGKVVSNTVEAFDENVYNKDDLKGYIKEVVSAYNAENPDTVKQKSLNVKEGRATLVMEYANEDVYEDFEGVEIFVGTVAEAVEAGYAFDVEFANVADGAPKACTSEEFMTGDYKVVIIKANVNVSLDKGQICYVSSVNTQSAAEGLVVIKEGANLLATGVVESTEAVTESTETEIEGAISEDELLSGEEEEIIFDFGDEEVSTNPYSNVYTYIIYK